MAGSAGRRPYAFIGAGAMALAAACSAMASQAVLALAIPIALGAVVAIALSADACFRDRWVESVLSGTHEPARFIDLVKVMDAPTSVPGAAESAAGHLASLIPRVTNDIFYGVPFKQRYSLCSLLVATGSAPLALALIDLFDRAAYPVSVMCLDHVAQGRACTSHEAVVVRRAAACRDMLVAALNCRRHAAVLLRPSSADTNTLLRPMPHGPEPDEKLLRPVGDGDSPDPD